jgi:predicted anti-sigma-YlaC factor YlaD
MSNQTTTIAQQLLSNALAAAAMLALIMLGAAFWTWLMRVI